jgi:hypothetical protein
MTSNTRASSGTERMMARNGAAKRGVTSLGFTSTAQPASSAGTESISDSAIGKFHGLITPTSGYGTSWWATRSVGMIFESNSTVLAIAGARSHQRRMLRAAETTSPAATDTRPVSMLSACTSGSRCASSASAKRRMTAMRAARPASRQATCSWRSAWQRAASSLSVGGVNSKSSLPLRGLRTTMAGEAVLSGWLAGMAFWRRLSLPGC